MAESIESLALRMGQQNQIIDEYRVALFTMEQKLILLVKMMEEKGFMAKGEFDKRWPVYLKNDVGVIGPDGVMEGSLKVSLFGEAA
jgi:hypothetical protein